METLQCILPYYTLELINRSISQQVAASAGPAPGRADAKARWNPQFDDIRVPVKAQWQDLELAARDLAALKVGDVLEMSPTCLDKVDVQLAETSRFRGRLGTRGNHWAVELTEVLKK